MRCQLVLATFTAIAALASLATCSREDGEPDPPAQVLVPCDRNAGEGDPLACPPVDASVDAALDAAPVAPPDAVIDAPPDAP